MAKLHKPLLSISAIGAVGKDLVLRARGKAIVIEAKPHPKDPRTPPQLAWRTMYQLCTVLWHAQSPAEKQQWESVARPHHMIGYAWFMSQCLKPNPGIYLPLAGGTMSGEIDMATNKIINLKAPTNPNDAARLADAGAGTGKRIEDADQDTYVDTEEAADEDHVRMGTAGVEAFDLDPNGILGLAKQSRAKAYRSTSSQVISTGAYTKLQLNAESFDEHNEFDSTTNYRFTASTTGYYTCSGVGTLHDLGDGKKIIVAIYKNGANAAYSRTTVGGIDFVACSPSSIIYLAANDYLELFIYHNHGSNRNAVLGAHANFLAIHKLS